jgi:hypothetical protein
MPVTVRYMLIFDVVMPGLVPGIHVLRKSQRIETWMAGTSPAMTKERSA